MANLSRHAVDATFHPAYLLRNQALTKRKIWEDMLAVMERLEMPVSDKQRGYFAELISQSYKQFKMADFAMTNPWPEANIWVYWRRPHGTALAGGMAQAGLVRGRQLLGTDVVPAAAKSFAKATGGRVVKNPEALLRQSDVVVLAVKPHQVIELLGELAGAATAKHLYLNRCRCDPGAARNRLGGKARVIRVMPTPGAGGRRAAGFVRGARAKVRTPSSPSKCSVP